MKFKGDIIITDPCYLGGSKDFWRQPDVNIFTGNGINKYGFTSYIWKDTIYGDWSCETINTDTNEVIGNFCADAGLVCVFLLDEVLKHNPDFDYHINRKHTTTLIEDFDGDIDYIIDDNQEAHIIGKGNINFITNQNGF